MLAVLYALTGAGAISAVAGTLDSEALRLARRGNMDRLIVHDEPRAVADAGFVDAAGREATIEDFAGSIVVLNFWATWCPPCVKEMPSLDRLQQEFDPENVLVVAIATGRNPPAKVDRFIAEKDIHALRIYYDEDTRFSGAMSIISIPVTVLIDRTGSEIARFIGDTEWDTDEAVELITLLAGQE